LSESLVWQSVTAQQWRSHAAEARRVLIVDDDESLARLLRTILRTAGLDVTIASSGEEALRLTAEESFDVILLDLRMPGMDGRSVYRELRVRGIQTPVLIASAYGALTAQRELGAQGAIEKPFDPERLIEAVLHLLPVEKREGESGPGTPRSWTSAGAWH
jgi:CheY-like chemotaxis protein